MPDPTVVCDACGGARERAIGPELPGHTRYAPCTACGAIGIRRVGDRYVAPAHKKRNTKPYWESEYRGGKLLG